MLCGVYSCRPQDFNLHLWTQHRSLLPHVMSKASQLSRSQASNSPCRFCNRSLRRTHQCPVMTNAALLIVNTDGTGQSYEQPGDEVLRCDVCGQQHQELSQLHAHLYQEHRLEPQDWDPLRDQMGNNPVCSHCMACFSDQNAVKQHVTLGKCPSFNPLRLPTEQPISAEWQELLTKGMVADLRQAPTKRLALTLKCKFCQTAFQRTGELSLHLQKREQR